MAEVHAPVAALAAMVAALGSFDTSMPDNERIDCLRQFENLRGAVVAAQARMTVAFVDSQRAEQEARKVPAARIGRGIASQVGLARRVSPFAAARWVGFARIASTDLPETFAELSAGRTTEWRAILVARETAWLSREDRAEVDELLAPRLGEWGDKRTGDEARKTAYVLDPEGYVEHLRKVEKQRHVSLRPAPDVMARLSGLLPMAQGVAVIAALGRAADQAVASGDGRTRSQLMADTLVELCTGQSAASDVAVEIQLVMPADTLLAETVGRASSVTDYTSQRAERRARAERRRTKRVPYNLTTQPAGPTSSPESVSNTASGAACDEMAAPASLGTPSSLGTSSSLGTPSSLDAARRARIERRRRARDRRGEPALVLGYGPIPAGIARSLALGRSALAPTWIRRLFEHPETGELIAMESKRRTFTAGQRAFISTRDQHCRTPFCDAPIRHIDHVVPWDDDGRTTITNGDGTCAYCNWAKQAAGWSTRPRGPGLSPPIDIITPTGHQYVSTAPRLGPLTEG